MAQNIRKMPCFYAHPLDIIGVGPIYTIILHEFPLSHHGKLSPNISALHSDGTQLIKLIVSLTVVDDSNHLTISIYLP